MIIYQCDLCGAGNAERNHTAFPKNAPKIQVKIDPDSLWTGICAGPAS